MSKCSADETPVCCCMDVGTIMDNSDCTASYSRVFANRAEAEQTLAALMRAGMTSRWDFPTGIFSGRQTV